MKRVAAIAIAAAAAAVPVFTAGATTPDQFARLASCRTGLDPAQRAIEVEGRMRRVSGTHRMGMRFLLFAHQKGGPAGYQALSVPNFGTYAPSRAGVGTYDVFKTVDNLPPNAAYYRMSVGFRWYDRKGHVIRQRYATSKSCFQPDFRPDLRVRRFYATVIQNRPAHNRYTIAIHNAGRTAAGAFSFTVAFPSQPLRTYQVSGIGAGDTVQRSFTGPVCTAASTPTASLDTQNTVIEKDEGNNAATASCSS